MSKYVRRMPEVRTCLICGKEFEGSTSQKYCSRECKAIGIKRQKHEHYLYTKALASGRTVEEVKAADEGREIPKRSLDKKQVESTKIEPVRRGKWLEGSRVVRVYACSVCGWELYEKTDFCPHCGANMYEIEGL